MRISEDFVKGVLYVCSQPTVQIDMALNVFFPEVATKQTEMAKFMIAPDAGKVYDWLQEQFPTAPMRTPMDIDPDAMFREMLKHILAKAFNYIYVTPSKI